MANQFSAARSLFVASKLPGNKSFLDDNDVFASDCKTCISTAYWCLLICISAGYCDPLQFYSVYGFLHPINDPDTEKEHKIILATTRVSNHLGARVLGNSTGKYHNQGHYVHSATCVYCTIVSGSLMCWDHVF